MVIDDPRDDQDNPAHSVNNISDFKTPEAIGADEEKQDTPGEIHIGSDMDYKWPDSGKKFKLTKKELVIGISVLVVVILAVVSVFAFSSKPAVKKQAPKIALTKPMPAPEPTTVPSTLTGLPVSPSVNQRPVTAVMIENSTFARPQSGLDQAGVVFEAIAEGGITRFVALFQDTQPSYIGPVRSVRPYYITWLLGFDAAVAHVGGSPEAIHDLANWNVKDMNQFYNSSYFERITSRVAPHNVYTSIAQLNALESAKGFNTSSYTGFARKADQPSKTPNATTINFDISNSSYNVQYKYNASGNNYERFEGGAPHMVVDQSGNQTQIAPKVVIAMIMSYGLESDNLHSVYGTIGSGTAYVFQDGTVTQGTWHKASNTSQISFTNSNGSPIKLNEGNTWLTALGSNSDVSYTQ